MGKWCLHASLFLGNKDMFKNHKRFDFWHIQTADIVELIGPEKTIALLLKNYSEYFNDFTWWLSGERSLPFGLLVLVLSCAGSIFRLYEQALRCNKINVMEHSCLLKCNNCIVCPCITGISHLHIVCPCITGISHFHIVCPCITGISHLHIVCPCITGTSHLHIVCPCINRYFPSSYCLPLYYQYFPPSYCLPLYYRYFPPSYCLPLYYRYFPPSYCLPLYYRYFPPSYCLPLHYWYFPPSHTWIGLCFTVSLKSFSKMFIELLASLHLAGFTRGVQSRSRAVLAHALGNNAPCPDKLWESRPCEVTTCRTFIWHTSPWTANKNRRVWCERSDGLLVTGTLL